MASVIFQACLSFCLTIMTEKKTEVVSRTTAETMQSEAAGQLYNAQKDLFVYFGRTVSEDPGASAEISRRARGCWVHIKTYGKQRNGHPVIELDFEGRIVRAKLRDS